MFKRRLSHKEIAVIFEDIYNQVIKWIETEIELYKVTEDNQEARKVIFYYWCRLHIENMQLSDKYDDMVYWLTRGGLDNNQITVNRIPDLISRLCVLFGTDTVKDFIDRDMVAIAYSYNLPLKLVWKMQNETRALWLLHLVQIAQMHGDLHM